MIIIMLLIDLHQIFNPHVFVCITIIKNHYSYVLLLYFSIPHYCPIKIMTTIIKHQHFL